MRNLAEYPVTLAEIEECLLWLSQQFQSEKRPGDMRALLLREAAKIVVRCEDYVFDDGED